MRYLINLGLSLLIILGFIYAIYEKQQIINNGQIVYLKLAPVDPRSLMQGDYMRLRYAIENNHNQTAISGFVKLGLDDKNIAHFMTYFNDKKISPNGTILFKYNMKKGRFTIEPSSFLFQQGLRQLYERAEYGVFKINDKQHLLVGLADGDLKHIKPPKE